jgi:hypothetical protein
MHTIFLSTHELFFISVLCSGLKRHRKIFAERLIFPNSCPQDRTSPGLEVENRFEMSSGHTSSDVEPDQALLCWSEAPNSPSREEFVQVLETHLSEAVIKSTLKVNEKTKVTLIGKDYTGIGIVKSCREDGKNFIVTIGIGGEWTRPAPAGEPDPSVMVIDEFITEDQEAQILHDLSNSPRHRFPLPKVPMLLRYLLLPGC